MKKILKVLFLSLLLVLAGSNVTNAEALNIKLKGEVVIFPDAQPFMDKNGRVLVPARFISESLGATVVSDNKTKTVTITKENNVIRLTIDKKVITVNGVNKELDTVAIVREERTFVPLRFVSQALGEKVGWDAVTMTASIGENTQVEISKPATSEGLELLKAGDLVAMEPDKETNKKQYFFAGQGVTVESSDPNCIIVPYPNNKAEEQKVNVLKARISGIAFKVKDIKVSSDKIEIWGDPAEIWEVFEELNNNGVVYAPNVKKFDNAVGMLILADEDNLYYAFSKSGK